MTTIIITDKVGSQFEGLVAPVEVRNESGKLLGRFVPVFDPAEYEGLEPQISKEEFRRRMQSKGKTYTTAEVLAYLEKL
jgi:hypothetical protein